VEHHPLRERVQVAIGVGIVGIGLLGCNVDTSTDNQLKDSVLHKYNMTDQAIAYIDQFPFYNRHTTINGGGRSYLGQWWEVYSDEEEAIVHEASHMYSPKVMSPEFCTIFDQEIKEEADKALGYFHTLYYGDGQNFKGLKDNCTEEYASISSYSMGDKTKLPVELQGFYKTLYKWGK
jgi:hypothetical protein